MTFAADRARALAASLRNSPTTRAASKFWRSASARQDAWLVLGLALCARLLVVAWAWRRFPPADDGQFYQVVAQRIAQGLGYTWQWPDGVVTYAAHYPVGYPALIGGAYAVLGPQPGVAMLVNAALGTGGVMAAYALGRRAGQRGPALLVGVLAALHPSLVFYTPALMTEGVTAAFMAILGWLSVQPSRRASNTLLKLAGLGLVLGALVLFRPQALLLAPLVGAIGAQSATWPRRLGAAAFVTTLAVLVCLPWTYRNCRRLDHCAFVSANGGWNLFIGAAPKATGAWVSIDELGVPAECRNEFGEAGKDRCFGRAGLREIVEHPGHFLALVPRKLSATFDWSGAPGHYLSASNGRALGGTTALWLGIAEAVVLRLTLLASLWRVGWADGKRARLRRGLAALSAPWLFMRPAWLSYLGLCVVGLALGRDLERRSNVAFAVAVVASTAFVHAIFFGAGRYGLVCVLAVLPLIAERRELTCPPEGVSGKAAV